MGPIIYRHDAYWGAPRTGCYYDSLRLDFGFRPRSIYCGNPFTSFMGGFTGGFLGGLIASSACGWGGSYASYPGASVSLFPSTYSSAPMSNFGYDYSALALEDAFARFSNSFSVPRNMTAPAQSSAQTSAFNWTMPASTSNSSTSAPTQTWSMPFSSLTQSARPHQTYSVLPKRTASQTSESIAEHRANVANSGQVSNDTNSTVAQPSAPIQSSNAGTPAASIDQEQAMDVAKFNAECKGGDCGDYTDRLYYNSQKGEWEKSTKKGYPKQPIAPESTLVEVPEQYTTDKSGIKHYANPEALKHFMEMSNVAFAERGIQITTKSSYRRYKDQEREFEADKERVRKLKAEGSKPEAIAAPPGYSEHHTGFAFDLADSSPINMRNDEDFLTDKSGNFVLDKKTGKRIPVAAHVKWLEKKAKIFGFEMSYPPDNKLGVTKEGWHWRFNPTLCEQHQAKREELLKKYQIEIEEKQLKQTTTLNEASAQEIGESFLDIAKRKGMEAEAQRYHEIMDDFNNMTKDEARLIARAPIAGAIADHQELLDSAIEEGNKAEVKKYLDALERDIKRYNKAFPKN